MLIFKPFLARWAFGWVIATTIAALGLSASLLYAEELPHVTIRYWKSDQAQRLVDAAISPDGRYAAIASSIPDLSLVRIADGEVIQREAYGSYGGLAFSADGSRILNCSEPMRIYDGRTLKQISKGKAPSWPGTVGVNFEARNGKILIKEVLADSPAARSGKLKVGDELFGFAEGPEPEMGRVDFDNEWKSVVGWSLGQLEVFTEVPPGTVVRVKVIAKGKLEPEVVLLERVGRARGPDGKDRWTRLNSAEGQRLAGTINRGVLLLRHAPTGLPLGGVRPVNLKSNGSWKQSPDGSMIAIAGAFRGNGGGLGLEIHSLREAGMVAAANIPAASAWCGTFTPDGKQFAVGTQDSIEIFDLAEQKWVRRIPLFEGGKRDAGVATRGRTAGGFGLEGDAFLETGPTRIFVSAAKVRKMAISKNGLVAAGGGNGVLRLIDFESGKVLREITRVDKEGEVQRVDFTPDGSRVLYFTPGTLHIVDVSSLATNRSSEKE